MRQTMQGVVFSLLIALVAASAPALAEEPAAGQPLSEALATLADQLVGQLSPLSERDTWRVTVEGFSHLDGRRSALSRYVGDELLTALIRTGTVRVQERGPSPTALAASELAEDLDPAQVEQLQQQLGADFVIVGTIADLGSMFKIHARVIEIGTRRIPAASGVLVAKDPTIRRLADEPVHRTGEPQEAPPSSNTGDIHAAEAGAHLNLPTMRIHVEDVVVGYDRITVLLRYDNKTDRELVIGLVAPGPKYQQGMRTFLLDEAGNQFTYTGGSGLAEGWGFAIRNWAPGTTWLRVPPENSASASLTFQEVTKTGGMFVWTNVADQIGVKAGTTFTLVSEQAYVDREQPERRFTVRIPGIQTGNGGDSSSSK